MVRRKERVREEPGGPEISAERPLEARDALAADVRLLVEHQFTLMEQAHDRVRTEELAARLRERPGS